MEAKRKPINELHTDTRILINVLESNLVKGGKDTVSYQELSAAIARNVQNGARGLLNTARKHIEQEHGITLVCIKGQGVKKTNDLTGLLDQTTHHISRTSRKSVKRVLNAMPNIELSNTDRTAINARLSQLGAISMFAKPSSTKVIEGKVAELQKELPTAETLRLFGK